MLEDDPHEGAARWLEEVGRRRIVRGARSEPCEMGSRFRGNDERSRRGNDDPARPERARASQRARRARRLVLLALLALMLLADYFAEVELTILKLPSLVCFVAETRSHS